MKRHDPRRPILTALLFATISFAAQAQQKSGTPVPHDGFWVVEAPAKGHSCTIRFYTTDKQLIYEETLNRSLRIARPKTRRQLNAALEQTLFVWNATHQVPTDRQWVAVQFDKK